MAKCIVLYHSTPAPRLTGILRRGIRPELARGALKVAWLHTPGRMAWAADHVAQRHGSAAVVSLRVLVPRAWLTRRRRGIYTSGRPIPPSAIQAVNVAGLIRRAAA